MKKLLLGFLMLFAYFALAQDPSLPIDFDDPADDAWVGGGGSVYSLESTMFAPDVVGKIVGGTDQWNSRVDLALGTYIDMTTASKTFTFDFYTTEAVVMTGLFQIGLEKDGGYAIEMQFTTDGLIGWETITLDFNGATNAWPNAGEPVVYGNYAQVSIFTNFGDNGTSTYYFDDIAGPPNGAVVGADPIPTTQPVQPTADPGDVISVFSDVYTDLANYWHPGWGQTTVYSDELIPGIVPDDHITKLKYLNYEAVVLDGAANPTNIGAMEYAHIDIWSVDDTPIRMYLLTGPEPFVELATVAGDWVSFNIPIGDFVGANLAAFWGIKFESGNWAPGSSPLVYFDNIYFWKTPGPTFDPANGAINVPANVNPTITFPLPVEMAGGSTITNGDIPSIVTMKETDAAGADVPFTGTINPAEDVLTIIPDANLNLFQDYYLALNHEVIQYQGASLIEGADVTFSTESGPFELPITFDEPTINYGVNDWGGNASSIVVDPTDPTNMVMETFDGDWEWSGSFLAGPSGTGLNNAIPFAAGATTMTMRVWSPEAGVPIIFKVENGTNGGIAAEVWVNTTMAGAWETMVFDLSAQLNLAEEYHKIVLLFNAGINEPGDTYYWDDIYFGGPATSAWNGSAKSSDWHDAGNWDNGVPGSTTDVTIPSGLTNYPTISAAAACNDITLVSDAAGTATLLGNGYLTVNGTATVQRYYATGGTTQVEWHLVSAPVSDAAAGIYTGYYLQEYFELTDSWSDVTGIGDPLTSLQGFAFYAPNDGMTFDYAGTMGDGAYALPISAAGPDNDHWNLFGNPYPSALDWDLVAPANLANLQNGAVYYLDQATGNYVSYNGGLGGGVRYVPPGQGFFVSGAIDLAPFSVDNTMRTHTGGSAYYKEDFDNMLVLSANGNDYSDATYLRFDEEATTGIDKQFDAYKIFGVSNPELPQIYTTSGVDLSINVMSEAEMVAAGFKAGVNGQYTIKATEVIGMSNVTLEDLVTGEMTDILSTDYTFDYDTNDQDDRFIIHFMPTSVSERIVELIDIYSHNNNVYVSLPEDLEGQMTVYNAMGQEIITSSLNEAQNVVTVEEYGFYIVKVSVDGQHVSKKVFVK